MDIEPAVRVHVGTCDGGSGPYVRTFAESGLGDVLECTVLEVQKEPVGNGLSKLVGLLVRPDC